MKRDDERYVAIAEVARPHGIDGELRLRVFNPESDLLAHRPRMRLVCPDGSVRHANIRAARAVPGALLVRLEGVTDRSAADSLRGARLEVPRAELEPTEDDEYYWCDLEGCRVEHGGQVLGRVVEVVSYPTCDALLVERADGEGRIEVPLTAAYIGRIDVDAGAIELVTIEGLS